MQKARARQPPTPTAAAVCIYTLHSNRRQAVLDVSGEVPQEAIRQLLAACRSGVFDRMQQQVGGARLCAGASSTGLWPHQLLQGGWPPF